MIDFYSKMLHLLGFGLCHQLPERSFIYGGVQFPVCARCCGIYVGIILGLGLLFLLYRGEQRTGIPSKAFFAGAILAVLVIGFDGITSYLGMRTTTNVLRLITGLMLGAAMAPITYSLFVESLVKHSSSKKILDSGRDIVLWILVVPAGCVVVYVLSPLLGMFAAGFQGLLIIATFWFIALILVGLAPRFGNTIQSLRDLIVPAIWAFPFGCAIILLCVGLQLWATHMLV